MVCFSVDFVGQKKNWQCFLVEIPRKKLMTDIFGNSPALKLQLETSLQSHILLHLSLSQSHRNPYVTLIREVTQYYN
jgi:hypothetical protein